MWLVNENTKLAHLEESSRVGKVVFQDDMNGRSQYTSMIFSLRNTNNGVAMHGCCYGICHGISEQYVIQYDVPMMDPLSEIQYRSVRLSHAIDVSLQDNYTTNVLVCRSSSGKVIWRKQGTLLAGFNGGSQVGDAQHHVHTLDASTVLGEAVVLERTEQHVTTALFYTDQYDVGSYTISCTSDQDSANVNIPATSTASDVSTWQQLSSEGSTATSDAASIIVSSCK